ncbi:hypothetical protein T439DRAFT_353035 [Meredithblackwellia eburnea MCA 4105]
MAGRIPISRATLFVLGVTGVGYAIMAATTPSEQQFYDSLAPDLKRKVDESKKFKQIQLEKQQQLEAIHKSAESEKPVWSTK